MSYKALINKNIKMAFRLIGDLAEEVILTKKLTSDYNFTTQTAAETTQNITTKAVITDADKESEDHNVMKKVMIFMTQDINNITAYDTITANSVIYKIGPLIKSDTYLTIVEVYKEV
jgi:hypothetical protein